MQLLPSFSICDNDEVSTSSDFLIVGLGNPGPQYERTRHNIGYLALDELAERTSPMPASLSVHKRANALVAQARLGSRKVILAKPRTFMNLTGGPTKALADFFKIPPANIIVLFDDLEIDFGQVRLRPAGTGAGDHGHNGLKNITKALGTKDYVRAGMGIGRPPGRMEVKSFVLKPFAKKEMDDVPIIVADMADEVERHIATRS